ncbi:condensation domain-containing protein [Streptomyces sp. NPDC057794]|uniref:condensation domain-containing protein n=1 Tax=Streptomyces sp. NPDC057794 TaxID=3346251 RepID=UPI0036791D51
MAPRPVVEDVLPLSPTQEGMVFHALYDEHAPDVYTGQLVLRLEGPLDAGRLRTAADALLTRHANLRAAFRTQRSGRRVQVIAGGIRTPWRETDLSGLPPAERQRAFEELLARDREVRFDLTRPPLLRVRLVAFGDRDHRLLISSHHLLWDGWSAPVLVRELFRLHTSGGDPAALPPVRPYRDYLAWLSRQDRTAAEQAWRDALHDLDEPCLLAPGARDLPAERPGRHVVELTGRETEALTAAARACGVTVSTVLQGLWAVLLARYTGRLDVVLGGTVSGRDADVPGIESMVGLFITTLPVRVRLRPAEPLADLLRRIQSERSALLGHEHLGLAGIQRAAGHDLLFDTLLVFESYPIDDEGIADALGPGGPRMTGVSVRDATHYPLTLTALPGDRLTLTFSHRPSALDEATVTDIATGLHRLVRAFTEDPGRPVGRLDTAPGGADRDADPPERPRATVRDLFEQQAARTPHAPAVHHGDTTLTFAELDAAAEGLAAALLARGAGPETIVAVALPRGPGLVVALLAVLKAGAACMPLDPAYPPERIALMLRDARPRLVVSDRETARLLALDPESVCDPGATATAAARPALSPDHPAYVVFTSGSTGRPKGVLGTQRALANRLAWGRNLSGGPGGVRVAKSPISFIDGLTELLGALVAGEAVALADDESAGDPAALAALAGRHGATTLTAVPSLHTTLVESTPPGGFTSVRTWISSGEPLTTDLARRITARWPGSRLVNLYGCSEAAGDSLAHVYAADDGAAEDQDRPSPEPGGPDAGRAPRNGPTADAAPSPHSAGASSALGGGSGAGSVPPVHPALGPDSPAGVVPAYPAAASAPLGVPGPESVPPGRRATGSATITGAAGDGSAPLGVPGSESVPPGRRATGSAPITGAVGDGSAPLVGPGPESVPPGRRATGSAPAGDGSAPLGVPGRESVPPGRRATGSAPITGAAGDGSVPLGVPGPESVPPGRRATGSAQAGDGSAPLVGPAPGRVPPGRPDGAAVPLGRPIDGTRVYVLDPFLRPAPAGAAGELYLAGDGLARGYLDQPGRTAERFVADPFGPPGGRLYRTGDLARLRSDGTVEFLGRADQQVKIRGFRVEPCEVEAAVRALPGVRRAAVVARQDGTAPRRLVAYAEPEPDGDGVPDPAALRLALAERLPAPLVPAAVVVLPALPLTPSGKLDRRALPAPDFTAGASTFAPPRTEPEKALCGLFAEVLGVERVGVHDDFFALGGDSIVSVRLADRARRAGLGLSPRDVFTHRTPAGLARALPDGTAPQEEFTATAAPLVSLSPSQLDNVKARWRSR